MTDDYQKQPILMDETTTKQYMVARGNSAHELNLSVNVLLKAGWRLQGGVAITKNVDGFGLAYAQAMVLDVE